MESISCFTYLNICSAVRCVMYYYSHALTHLISLECSSYSASNNVFSISINPQPCYQTHVISLLRNSECSDQINPTL